MTEYTIKELGIIANLIDHAYNELQNKEVLEELAKKTMIIVYEKILQGQEFKFTEVEQEKYNEKLEEEFNKNFKKGKR